MRVAAAAHQPRGASLVEELRVTAPACRERDAIPGPPWPITRGGGGGDEGPWEGGRRQGQQRRAGLGTSKVRNRGCIDCISPSHAQARVRDRGCAALSRQGSRLWLARVYLHHAQGSRRGAGGDKLLVPVSLNRCSCPRLPKVLRRLESPRESPPRPSVAHVFMHMPLRFLGVACARKRSGMCIEVYATPSPPLPHAVLPRAALLYEAALVQLLWLSVDS